MKTYALFLSASMAVLALTACSPSNTTSDASDASAISDESPAAVVETDTVPVTESVATSAASVVVKTTEVYDETVIHDMGQRPGLWQVDHTDPKTHAHYVTKVCVDKDFGPRMQGVHVTAPADRRDYQTKANWMGNCPTDMRGGDVDGHDGKRVSGYGDHRSDHHDAAPHDPTPPHNGDNHSGDSHSDASHSGYDHSRDGNDHSSSWSRDSQGHGQHSSASSVPSHNPHTTPGEDHANDPGANDHGANDHSASSSRDHQPG